LIGDGVEKKVQLPPAQVQRMIKSSGGLPPLFLFFTNFLDVCHKSVAFVGYKISRRMLCSFQKRTFHQAILTSYIQYILRFRLLNARHYRLAFFL